MHRPAFSACWLLGYQSWNPAGRGPATQLNCSMIDCGDDGAGGRYRTWSGQATYSGGWDDRTIHLGAPDVVCMCIYSVVQFHQDLAWRQRWGGVGMRKGGGGGVAGGWMGFDADFLSELYYGVLRTPCSNLAEQFSRVPGGGSVG